ncbi:MAG: MarR family transcriptional regulator [Eubacteriales bacterium]
MTDEVILMKLLSITEEVRHKERDKSKKSSKTKKESAEKVEKKNRHKFSPVAQNTLCLLLKEGAMNQRTIAKNNKVSGQAVSDVMKKLEARELITREQGELNNENIISLTEKGKEKAIELQEKLARKAEQLLKDFSLEQRQQLFSYLEKIEKNLEILQKETQEEV